MNIPITRGSTGLSTQCDPVRSYYSKATAGSTGLIGIVDLQACINTDISDRGRYSRRRPITRIIAAAAHSLCPVDSRYCLFVSGGLLCLLHPDFATYTAIGTVGDLPMSAVVLDGVAYWCNGVQRGKVVDGVMDGWNKPDVVYGNKTRIFDDPPTGKLITQFNGRLYMAKDNVVWVSEPFGPDLWSLEDGFLSFESNVKMIRGVAGGIYVSDSYATWFLSGNGPDDFDWRVVYNYPVIPGSDSNAVGVMSQGQDGGYVWTAAGKRECALWCTDNGFMHGSADGNVINLTDEKIDLPGTGYLRGATMVNGSMAIAAFI